MDGFFLVQAHAAAMQPSANFRIWSDTSFHRVRGGFQSGPVKCSNKTKVQLQKALTMTTAHISTLRSPRGEKKDYVKKPKKNGSVQNPEKPQLTKIPREAKALLLYED